MAWTSRKVHPLVICWATFGRTHVQKEPKELFSGEVAKELCSLVLMGNLSNKSGAPDPFQRGLPRHCHICAKSRTKSGDRRERWRNHHKEWQWGTCHLACGRADEESRIPPSCFLHSLCHVLTSQPLAQLTKAVTRYRGPKEEQGQIQKHPSTRRQWHLQVVVFVRRILWQICWTKIRPCPIKLHKIYKQFVFWLFLALESNCSRATRLASPMASSTLGHWCVPAAKCIL